MSGTEKVSSFESETLQAIFDVQQEQNMATAESGVGDSSQSTNAGDNEKSSTSSRASATETVKPKKPNGYLEGWRLHVMSFW